MADQIDDKVLIQAINDSPLKDEDKAHWLELVPKMDDEHRERLFELLTSKTKVVQAIDGIQKALDIIAEAEGEAEEEIRQEEEEKQKEEEVKKKIEESSENLQDTPSEEELQARKAAEEQRLAQLRSEIGSISMAVHGTQPPSYPQAS